MAYSASNPPQLRNQSFNGSGPSEWIYSSADDHATVDTAGYITNAAYLGMKAGDLVIVRCTADNITKTHSVVSVNAPDVDNPDASADLSDGTTIGTATNTD